MTFEEADLALRSLVGLSTGAKWSREAAAEAYRHMQALRRNGFSNAAISAATNGRWSESTVKKVTAGTRITSPEVAQEIISNLNQVYSNNLTANDIKVAVDAVSDVNAAGGHLSEIISFINDLKSAGIALDVFLRDYREMKTQLLTPGRIKEFFESKKALEEKKIDLIAIPRIKTAADKFGDLENILSAIELYGTLDAMRKELADKKQELDSTKELVQKAKDALSQHKELETSSAALLSSYKTLEKDLNDLSTEISEKLKTDLSKITNTFTEDAKTQTKKLTDDLKTNLDEFLKIAKSTLEQLGKDITGLKTKADTGTSDLSKTIEQATSNAASGIQKLADQAVIVGKGLQELETRRKEAQAFLELADLVKDPATPAPTVSSTFLTVLRAFQQSVPHLRVRYPSGLEQACTNLISRLEAELT